jgi:hypothetical protein
VSLWFIFFTPTQVKPAVKRDPYPDRNRQDPAFVQFMAEMKNRSEGYRREFG